MKGLSRTLAVTLEGVGILVVVVGIAIEAITFADIGHFVISTGSILIAGGAMIFAKFVRFK